MKHCFGIVIIFGIYNLQRVDAYDYITFPFLNSEPLNKTICWENNKLTKCSSKGLNDLDNFIKHKYLEQEKTIQEHNLIRRNSLLSELPFLRGLYINSSPKTVPLNQLYGRIPSNNLWHTMLPRGNGITPSNFGTMPMYNMITNNVHNQYSYPPLRTTPGVRNAPQQSYNQPKAAMLVELSAYDKFLECLDNFERKLFMVTFNKLTSNSPEERQENGMSFVQSGYFLQLTLMALSLEVDPLTKAEIERVISFQASDMETINVIRKYISMLPDSSDMMKFRRASRLMLWPGREVSLRFRTNVANALRLNIDNFNGTETPDKITTMLNQKIQADSGGAIRDTFDEDDFTGGITAVQITTLYFRCQWRSDPTVLNGTWPFRNGENAEGSVRMIRLNDVMGYADLRDLNAEALEIPYTSPELSLVILVPRTSSLRSLAEKVPNISLRSITSRMKKVRVAATLPLYTLRMTLLLPNKLQAMGVSRLFDVRDTKPGDPIRVSHMVQRIMFWAEAGRNAYKDDGFEWDKKPQMQIHIDRPYIFFVRWRNITIMNGNFVL